MLRRIVQTGVVAGLSAAALAGCSWPGALRPPATSQARLAGGAGPVPVSTFPRTPSATSSTRGTTTRLPPAPEDLSAGGLEIDSGTATTADEAKQASRSDGGAVASVDAATLLELRGNLEGARQQFDRALAAAPGDLRVLAGFARFADRHGQGSVAAELYARILEDETASPLLRSEAGLGLCRNGRGEAGLAACRKALAAAPDHPRLVANLAEAQTAARHFRDSDERLASRDRARNGRGDVSFEPVSASADDGRALRTADAPTETAAAPSVAEEAPTRPFSPGSTARLYERPLPPVSGARRASNETNAETSNPKASNVAIPSTPAVDEAPRNGGSFIPPDSAPSVDIE